MAQSIPLRRPFIFSKALFPVLAALLLNVSWAAGSVSDTTLEADLLRLTNEARLEAGRAPLTADEALAHAAREHAAEMTELGYFSHTSPIPANASLSQRAAKAGSFALTLGENLARVYPTDAAAATVSGWLGSPGHRANLLSAEFSHVGFGSAPYADGQLAMAQVFAYQPAAIAAASLVSTLAEVPTLDVTLELSQAAEVAIFFGERSSRSVELAPGKQLLYVPLSQAPTLPLALQLGVRSAGEGFILQDSGWLQTSGWSGEPDIQGRQAALHDVVLRSQRTRQYEVRLTFADDPGLELEAWQGENLVRTEQDGSSLTVSLPEPDSELPLYLGVAEGGGNYHALYGFSPQVGETLELSPVAPQD